MQIERCPLFVEGFAGKVALSLALHREGLKPLFAHMGGKQAYSGAILDLMGLKPGLGAESYIWAETDPFCMALLRLYNEPEWAAKLIKDLGVYLPDPTPGNVIGAMKTYDIWDQFITHPDLSDVAKLLVAAWSVKGLYLTPHNRMRYSGPDRKNSDTVGGPSVHCLIKRLQACTPEPIFSNVSIYRDFRVLYPSKVPEGTIVYLDPPYPGVTGYEGQGIDQEEICLLALRWYEAGADVYVSLDEPIWALCMDHGWDVADISEDKRGCAVRTNFSTQHKEYVTFRRHLG